VGDYQPLAQAAAVAADALEVIRQGARPQGLAADRQAVHDFCVELLAHHDVADATYQRVRVAIGEPGVVELATLVGYFAMVSWAMNVARTPSRPTTGVEPLVGWPV
jgi:4-carboxymuconolactone decarboxylase